MSKNDDKNQEVDKKKGEENMAILESTLKECNNLSVYDIEKILGIDNIEPIHLTESDAKDRLDKTEDFSDWYEEELRNFYEQNK